LSAIEKAYLEVPSAASARANLKFITSIPHVAGTDGDQILANFMVQEFTQAGIPNVSIFDLEVYLNYPLNHQRSKVILKNSSDNSTVYEAKLAEPVLPEDPTSDTPWRDHIFHGYSPSGSIQGAAIVYANYGRPQDFEALEKAGVSVNGTVVLARYGKCFRGLKVKNAQYRGAVAVLIYSDPMEDGYAQHPGDEQGVYPEGPWRPEFGIQRGSVQFNSLCGGDPFRADPRYGNITVQLLCGVSSPMDLIPTIPSLPLSYADAEPLLRHMGGPLASDVAPDFEGGIHNLTYHVGGTLNYTLDMEVHNTELGRRSIPNVVGVIPGRLPPAQDMPVLLGNHRDAWVYGAADPGSGTAAMLEVARGLGSLYQDLNWRPLRTIYLLSWSGEEYGLLGSTGWGELTDLPRALAYLNVDTVVSGDKLDASASPSLTTLWKTVLHDWNATQKYQLWDVNSNRAWAEGDDELGILGSGSDFTVFLDHLGIPSLDMKFEKHSGTYGQYHSIYDSFAWMDKFGGRPGEPGSSWEIMATGAKIWGLLALRLADHSIVPLDPIAQGAALLKYTKALEEQKLELDFSSMDKAVKHFQQTAAQLELLCQEGGNNGEDHIEHCNERFGLVERQFLIPEGLPKRRWFRHSLQAPGMNLGYAAEAFPGIQQAIDDGDLTTAQEQIQVIADRIQSAATFLQPK
jgi:N-acetylated-alpha-linked acidic dipeptidase